MADQKLIQLRHSYTKTGVSLNRGELFVYDNPTNPQIIFRDKDGTKHTIPNKEDIKNIIVNSAITSTSATTANSATTSNSATTAANLTGNITTGQVTNLASAIQTTKVNSATTADKVVNALTFATGTTSASESYDGSAQKTVTIPSKTSHITNDSGYITKDESGLTYYYKKTETYTQTEVNNLLSAIPKFAIKVVTALPTTGESATIYLISLGTSGVTEDLYKEYIYVDSKWELLGTAKANLQNYYTKTEADGRYWQQTQRVNSAVTADGVYVTGGTLQITNSGNSNDGNQININALGSGNGITFSGETINVKAKTLSAVTQSVTIGGLGAGGVKIVDTEGVVFEYDLTDFNFNKQVNATNIATDTLNTDHIYISGDTIEDIIKATKVNSATTADKVVNKLNFTTGTTSGTTGPSGYYDGSAQQTITIPSKTSHLENDSGFISKLGGEYYTSGQTDERILNAVTNIIDEVDGDIKIELIDNAQEQFPYYKIQFTLQSITNEAED